MLEQMTKTEGIGITLLENDKTFLENGTLKQIWQSSAYPERNYYLISHKKQESFFELLKNMLTNNKAQQALSSWACAARLAELFAKADAMR